MLTTTWKRIAKVRHCNIWSVVLSGGELRYAALRDGDYPDDIEAIGLRTRLRDAVEDAEILSYTGPSVRVRAECAPDGTEIEWHVMVDYGNGNEQNVCTYAMSHGHCLRDAIRHRDQIQRAFRKGWEWFDARYPLLLRSMRWVAILSSTEASCCLRDWARGSRCGGCEAVMHYGGPQAVIESAIRARHNVRTLYSAEGKQTRKRLRELACGDEVGMLTEREINA